MSIDAVTPGKSIGQAVKEAHQLEAAAKKQAAVKTDVGQRIGQVLNALFSSFGLGDPDFCLSVAWEAGIQIAIQCGVTKEKAIHGFERLWAAEVEKAEKMKDEQRKMLVNVARQIVSEKRPMPPELIANMTAMGCSIPTDVQAYYDGQAPQNGAGKVLEMKTETPN
jgi:hypothetical protein